jgi:hypothetical protein
VKACVLTCVIAVSVAAQEIDTAKFRRIAAPWFIARSRQKPNQSDVILQRCKKRRTEPDSVLSSTAFLRSIPRADVTTRFGQKDSPTACLICHSERDARWVAGQLQNWTRATGASVTPTIYP